MAKASFTFDEMVYNTVVNGKQIYYNNELKTIDYVKLMKSTRQLQIVCVDSSVFLANQDDVFDFEVNTPKDKKSVTLPKIKKD
jgi:hypothetical protein